MQKYSAEIDALDQLGDADALRLTISKTSAWGGTVRMTWHLLQSKVCNAECAPKLGADRLNSIGMPQNGQRGCGASVSMALADSARVVNER
jgi:hypothetical protein